ncbi:MAG: amino acid permease [Negativicutes bacterium]|nr:amino acid permease [Negativicutes bacterium]
MLQKLLRTKDVATMLTAKGPRLEKTMGKWDLLFLGIGSTIGTGIFVVTGVVAATHAGPGIMFSFILAGFACVCAGLAYAELASTVPISGSSYTYAYATLGELLAWLVGWNLILEYAVSLASVAAGWSGYMMGLIDNAFGTDFVNAWWANVPANDGIINIPAIAITLILTALLVRGMRESATTNNALVFVKVGAVLLFIVLAFSEFNPENWNPLLPFGWAGVISGASVVFFSYLGFDTVSTSAEECRNVQRDLPFGLVGSLLVCTLLYIFVSGLLTGVVKFDTLDNPEPVAYALKQIGFRFGAALVAVGAVAGLTSVLLTTLYGQTRIFFAMSRDGLIPEKICKLHSKYRTPHIVTWATGIFIAVIAAFFPIDEVAEMSNIGTYFAFTATSVGVLVLRKTRPDLERKFRCPYVWFFAPAAIALCVGLASQLETLTWWRFLIWSILGLAIYFAYSIRHSKLNR